MNTAELARRLDNLVRYGVIEQTDFTTDPVQPRVRVRTGDILTTWIPIAAAKANTDAEHDPVQIGEHVILLSPSGELAQATVIGKLFSDDFPSPDNSPARRRRKYRDGTRTEYDTASSTLSAFFPDSATINYNAKTSALTVTLPSAGTIQAVAPGGITLIGDITHEGNLTQIGNVTQAGTLNVSGLATLGGLAVTGAAAQTSEMTGGLNVTEDVVAGDISLRGHKHSGVQSGGGSTGGPQ